MSDQIIPVGAFCWEELQSTGVERVVPFYKELIGWSTKDWPLPDGTIYTLFGPEGEYVGGVQAHSTRETGDWTGWLCYINVEDVDDTVAEAAHLGGRVILPPHDIPDVGRSAVLADPEGVVFGLMRFQQPSTDPKDPIGSFCWRELMVRDAARAKHFYTTLFGWRTQTMDMGEMGEYTMYLAGERMVAGMMPIGPEQADAPAMWLPYVAVASVDELAGHSVVLGGGLCLPPMDVPGVGRFCIVTDPAGATIALITLSQPGA